MRAIVCARGIFGHVRRAVVGGDDRQPALPGRGLRRQRRGIGGAGGGRPGRAERRPGRHRARRGGRRSASGPRSRRSACATAPWRAWCCAGGEEIAASAVVSSADPHQTFLRLLDPAVLDPDELRRVQNYRLKGMASKVNFALVRPAGLHAAPPPTCCAGRIHIGASVDDLERAYDDAKYGGISRRPVSRRRDPVAGRSFAGAGGPPRDVGVRAVHAVRAARGDVAGAVARSWAIWSRA